MTSWLGKIIFMMRIVRWFILLIVLAALAAGVAYFFACNAAGPAIAINQPSVVGQSGTLDVVVDAPGAHLTALIIRLDQKGRAFPILEGVSGEDKSIVKEGDRLRITRPVGKSVWPELESGAATIS